jgi:hypothetical protein
MFTCPACDRPINQASEICPYCGVDLAPEPVARRRTAQRKGLVITLIVALLLVGFIWGMVWFVLPRTDMPPRAQAEAGAVAALRRVNAILNNYRRQDGTYPNTIEEVSGEAGAAYASARRAGYSLLYEAGSPGSDGNIHDFVLLARPRYYGYRSFYLDQTGVIRSTLEDRPATVHDPPIP